MNKFAKWIGLGLGLGLGLALTSLNPAIAQHHGRPDHGRPNHGPVADQPERAHRDSSRELYYSQNIHLMTQRTHSIFLDNVLRGFRNRGVTFNQVILVASSTPSAPPPGRGRGGSPGFLDEIELEINGRTSVRQVVSSKLTPVVLPVGMRVDTIRSISIRTRGDIFIASLGAVLAGDDLDPLERFEPLAPEAPPPAPEPVQQEVVVSEKIAGIHISGYADSENRQAFADYEHRCSTWKKQSEQILGNRIRELNCGAPKNVSGAGGFRYESAARLVFITYENVTTFKVGLSGKEVSGQANSERNAAISDYDARCAQLRTEATGNAQVPLLYFSCGPVAQDSRSEMFRYESVATIVFANSAPLRTQNAAVAGITVQGLSNSDKSKALAHYEENCKQWKNDLRKYNSERTVLISCGKLTQTAPYGQTRYESQGIAIMVNN